MLAPSTPSSPIRVLLVDDSGVSRALMTRWITEGGSASVVATANDGASAVAILGLTEVDVVVLDIEMPNLDGLSALPQLLAARPGVRILMASSFSERGAEVTLEALRLGASDAIAKPRAGWAARGSASFRDELVEHIHALGAAAPGEAVSATRQPPRPGLTYARSGGIGAMPRVIVMGASTGGPNALFRLIGGLPSDFPVPIVVAQHMPALFTKALARHLDDRSTLSVVEARDCSTLKPGTVYLAPGGFDVTLSVLAGEAAIRVHHEESDSGSHPSVDRLMASAVAVFGSRVLGVVLSGMGQDGLEGAAAVVSSGGAVLAQDPASTIVWGMPGAVVRAGLASEVLPPAGLAAAIVRAAMAEFTSKA